LFTHSGGLDRDLQFYVDRATVARIVVTALVVPADDPAFYALHDIDPAALRLLCVKAKNHFRAAFGPLCRTILEVDAPGPAGFELRRYPFRHAPQALVRAVAQA
jgi:microcystin degradation protein MlrC